MNCKLTHEQHRIQLRKEKLEEVIFSKRIKKFDIEDLSEKDLEISIEKLDIPQYLVEKYEKEEDKEYLIENLLFETDINVIKFALRKLREFDFRICENGDIELEEKIFDRLIFLLVENEDSQIKVN